MAKVNLIPFLVRDVENLGNPPEHPVPWESRIKDTPSIHLATLPLTSYQPIKQVL